MSLAPPDGWSVTSGVWGDNLNIDTSTWASGLASLRLSYDAALAAPIIWSPWIPLPRRGQIPPTALNFAPRIRIRSSSIAAGNTVLVEFYTYPQDRILAGGSAVVHSGVLNAANTWEEYGYAAVTVGSDSVWGRFRITKANTNFNCWADFVHLTVCPPYLRAGVSVTALTSGVWTNVRWASSSSSMITTSGLTDIRIYEPGMYSIYANPTIDNLIGGEVVQIRILSSLSGTPYNLATYIAGAAGSMTVTTSALAPMSITSTSPYETVQIQVLVNNAGRNAAASAPDNLFIVKNK